MDNHIRRILIPTDLSAFATQALRLGHFFHDTLGSDLTLLHVDEAMEAAFLIDHPLGYYFENAPDGDEALRQELRRQARLHDLPSSTRTLLARGSAARAILDWSEREKPDLIIMGTHGRAGWQRALLGSVTERVLRSAPCPVLTVGPDVLPPFEEVSIRRVVCPVDSSSVGRAAVQWANRIGNAFLAPIRFVGAEPRVATRIALSELSIGVIFVMGVEHRLVSDVSVFGTPAATITRAAHCPVLTLNETVAAQMEQLEPELAAV